MATDLKERYPVHSAQWEKRPPVDRPEPEEAGKHEDQPARGADGRFENADPAAAFVREHPEVVELRKAHVTSANREKLLEQVRVLRVQHWKDQAAKNKTDLTPEEVAFLGDVLRVRITDSGSVKELVANIDRDAARDYGQLMADVGQMRRMNEGRRKLAQRYPSMANEPLTPGRYVHPRYEHSKEKEK